jgi:hypothetical protein
MRTYTLILAALLAGPAASQDNPPKGRIEASAKRVKDLQQEQIAALRQSAAVGLKLAQSGGLAVGEAVEDRMSLLRAEVDAAASEADRVALYTKAVESLGEYEALANARHQAGRGTEHAALRVRATRLGVEVQLERARTREEQAKGR